MSSCNGVVLQPHPCRNMDGLGCSPFARHYWGNHCLFSFPAGTKMFQFPALAFRYALDNSFSFLMFSDLEEQIMFTYLYRLARYIQKEEKDRA